MATREYAMKRNEFREALMGEIQAIPGWEFPTVTRYASSNKIDWCFTNEKLGRLDVTLYDDATQIVHTGYGARDTISIAEHPTYESITLAMAGIRESVAMHQAATEKDLKTLWDEVVKFSNRSDVAWAASAEYLPATLENFKPVVHVVSKDGHRLFTFAMTYDKVYVRYVSDEKEDVIKGGNYYDLPIDRISFVDGFSIGVHTFVIADDHQALVNGLRAAKTPSISIRVFDVEVRPAVIGNIDTNSDVYRELTQVKTVKVVEYTVTL